MRASSASSSASRSGRKRARARRRQIDRLAIGGERTGAIGGVERIGDQHGRLAGARRDPALGGDGGEEQALARAVEHEHFVFGIDRPRQLVAAAEPFGDGAAERLAALVGRVAAEFVEMGGEFGPTKDGIGCCGSPTDRLMAGLPGAMPAISSVSRTNGERASTAGAGMVEGSRWAVIMDMGTSGRPAA